MPEPEPGQLPYPTRAPDPARTRQGHSSPCRCRMLGLASVHADHHDRTRDRRPIRRCPARPHRRRRRRFLPVRMVDAHERPVAGLARATSGRRSSTTRWRPAHRPRSSPTSTARPPAGSASAPAPGRCDSAARRSSPRTREEPWDDDSVWAVTCFVVRREHRGQGLNARLLEAAIDFARAHGARVIEAYPTEPASRREEVRQRPLPRHGVDVRERGFPRGRPAQARSRDRRARPHRVAAHRSARFGPAGANVRR